MSKRRKTERSVELLAEALGKRWGVTPRIAAGRALADALDREWDKLKALKEPRGVDHVREGEVAVMAQELWDEVGAFQVRQLVKFMWGDGVIVIGGRAVADAVTKILRAHGWTRSRRRVGGAVKNVWIKG